MGSHPTREGGADRLRERGSARMKGNEPALASQGGLVADGAGGPPGLSL